MKTKSSFSKYKCAHYKWYGLVKHISKKEDPNARILKSRKPGNIFIRLLACVQTQVNLIGGCWSSEGNPSSQDPAEALPCKLKVLLCKRTQMPDFASLRKPARIYGFVLTLVHTFLLSWAKNVKKETESKQRWWSKILNGWHFQDFVDHNRDPWRSKTIHWYLGTQARVKTQEWVQTS